MAKAGANLPQVDHSTRAHRLTNAQQRRLANTAFSGSSVRALHGLMVEETERLFQVIDSKPKGTPQDADELFCRMTLVRVSHLLQNRTVLISGYQQDVIGRTLFGDSFDAQSGKEIKVTAALNEGLEEIQKRISNPLRGLWWKATERLVENMYE